MGSGNNKIKVTVNEKGAYLNDKELEKVSGGKDTGEDTFKEVRNAACCVCVGVAIGGRLDN